MLLKLKIHFLNSSNLKIHHTSNYNKKRERVKKFNDDSFNSI